MTCWSSIRPTTTNEEPAPLAYGRSMTVEDFGARRTVAAEELLVLVGDYALVDESGHQRGRIESVGQEGLSVVVTVGEDTGPVELTFTPDAQVSIEPYDGGKAPVVP